MHSTTRKFPQKEINNYSSSFPLGISQRHDSQPLVYAETTRTFSRQASEGEMD